MRGGSASHPRCRDWRAQRPRREARRGRFLPRRGESIRRELHPPRVTLPAREGGDEANFRGLLDLAGQIGALVIDEDDEVAPDPRAALERLTDPAAHAGELGVE